jgi:hypothetical protein
LQAVLQAALFLFRGAAMLAVDLRELDCHLPVSKKNPKLAINPKTGTSKGYPQGLTSYKLAQEYSQTKPQCSGATGCYCNRENKLVLIDLDSDVFLDSGELNPKYRQVCELLKDTFCERSCSGKGLHFLGYTETNTQYSGKYELPGGVTLEIYANTSGRFCANTYQPFDLNEDLLGTPESCHPSQCVDEFLEWVSQHAIAGNKPREVQEPAVSNPELVRQQALYCEVKLQELGIESSREVWGSGAYIWKFKQAHCCKEYSDNPQNTSPRHVGDNSCSVCLQSDGKLTGSCLHASCKWTIRELFHEEPPLNEQVDMHRSLQALAKAEDCIYEPTGVLPAPPSGNTEPGAGAGAGKGVVDFWVPGFISEFMNYYMQTAPRPHEQFAFSAAITALASLGCRTIKQDRIDLRLFTVNLAASGGGKEHTRKSVQSLMFEAGANGLVYTDVASAQAAVAIAAQVPGVLLQIDEIGGKLRANSNSQHLAALPVTLMELYSTDHVRKTYADGKQVSCTNPRVIVQGASTPETFWPAVNTGLSIDGFLSRILVFEIPHVDLADESIGFIPVPEALLAFAKQLLLLDQPRTIHYSPKGRQLLSKYRRAIDSRVRDDREAGNNVRATIWVRAVLHIQKLALLFALSRSWGNLDQGFQVEECDLKAAHSVVVDRLKAVEDMLVKAATIASDEDRAEEQLTSAVLRQLADEPKSLTQIYRSTTLAHKKIKHAVLRLLERGEVAAYLTPAAGPGRPPTVLAMPDFKPPKQWVARSTI